MDHTARRTLFRRLADLIAAVCLTTALAGLAPAQTHARTRDAQIANVAYAVGLDIVNRRLATPSTDMRTGASGELTAFDLRTGAILKRIDEPYRWQSPDVLVNPAGNHLYVLAGRIFSDNKTLTESLTLFDPHSWSVLAGTISPTALHYNVTGPSTLLLSPDQSSLIVYNYQPHGDGRSDYWLSFLDANTLREQSAQVALPGCGVALFAVALGQVVAACQDANNVRFIDPHARAVVATIPLPVAQPYYAAGRPVGLVVSADQQTAYVITNDLRILAINVAAHTIARQVVTLQQQGQTVPAMYAVAASADGRHLIVGGLARPRDPASTYTLYQFSLPGLQIERTLSTGQYAHFVAAPTGGIFLFQMGDEPASSQTWRQRLTTSDLIGTAALTQFDGPIFHLSVPGTP